MLTIGVVGGVASGKSEVARGFERLRMCAVGRGSNRATRYWRNRTVRQAPAGPLGSGSLCGRRPSRSSGGGTSGSLPRRNPAGWIAVPGAADASADRPRVWPTRTEIDCGGSPTCRASCSMRRCCSRPVGTGCASTSYSLRCHVNCGCEGLGERLDRTAVCRPRSGSTAAARETAAGQFDH